MCIRDRPRSHRDSICEHEDPADTRRLLSSQRPATAQETAANDHRLAALSSQPTSTAPKTWDTGSEADYRRSSLPSRNHPATLDTCHRPLSYRLYRHTPGPLPIRRVFTEPPGSVPRRPERAWRFPPYPSPPQRLPFCRSNETTAHYLPEILCASCRHSSASLSSTPRDSLKNCRK